MKGVMRMFLLLALATVAPLVAAQQSPWGARVDEKAKARANAQAQANVAKTQPATHHPDWRAIHRDNDRDADDRPAGWARGRKVGWHGNDMPPGQVKRDPYEHHYRHHRRHHQRRDWDRDHERFRHHRDHDRDHDRH